MIAAIAAGANVPDALHLKIMSEQKAVMTGDIAQTKALYEAAKQELATLTARVGAISLDQQRVSPEIANLVQKVEELRVEHDTLKDVEVLDTMWCDPERTDDTAFGGAGCWGDNITDVRLESRRYRKDAKGNKIPGSETRWELCQILQRGSRTKDSRNVMDSNKFHMITADDDGGNKARKNLEEITGNSKRFFPSKGLNQPKLKVNSVAVAHRMAFVPVPRDTEGWAVEVRYVCFGYNTVEETSPKNMLLFGDTMNTSLSSEMPGFKNGFHPVYTEVLTSVGGAATENDAPTMRCFATAVEATNRTIKNIGTETAEESAAAAAAGKGTQVRTGPASVKPTSSSAWIVQIPIEEKPPVHGVRLRGASSGGVIYRSMADIGAEDQEGEPDSEPDEPNDGISKDDRVRPGAPSKRTAAKEGRIGIGTYVQDAKPLPIDNPIAKSNPAIATEVLIMTVPMGTVPDKETLLDASTMLKQRYKQASEIGTDVDDRLSQAAVDAGLTTQSPLKKKAKTEIEQAVGCKIFAPGGGNGPAEIAQGRPLLTGLPAE